MDNLGEDKDTVQSIPMQNEMQFHPSNFQDSKPPASYQQVGVGGVAQQQQQPGQSFMGQMQSEPQTLQFNTDTESLAPAPTDTQQEAAAAPMYSLKYYQQYFDVDATDVRSRLLKSMLPFTSKFIEEVAPSPDLYGPFWIATTLVFSLAAAGNFANWLQYQDTAPWSYDFNKVSLAACVVYGYVVIMPLAINCTAMYCTEAVGFVQLACVYGYSLTIFVPVCFLCIVPSSIAQWVFVGVAFVISAGMLFGNIGGRLDNMIPVKGKVVNLVLVIIHAALALVFKLYFFEYT